MEVEKYFPKAALEPGGMQVVWLRSPSHGRLGPCHPKMIVVLSSPFYASMAKIKLNICIIF